MDRGAWWATVHGGHRESDATEQLTLPLSHLEGELNNYLSTSGFLAETYLKTRKSQAPWV